MEKMGNVSIIPITSYDIKKVLYEMPEIQEMLELCSISHIFVEYSKDN
jgi:hypothetical protein